MTRPPLIPTHTRRGTSIHLLSTHLSTSLLVKRNQCFFTSSQTDITYNFLKRRKKKNHWLKFVILGINKYVQILRTNVNCWEWSIMLLSKFFLKFNKMFCSLALFQWLTHIYVNRLKKILDLANQVHFINFESYY